MQATFIYHLLHLTAINHWNLPWPLLKVMETMSRCSLLVREPILGTQKMSNKRNMLYSYNNMIKQCA